MQESDNIADINDENADIKHLDCANEEPIKIIKIREALEGDDFGKTEVNLKYGDKNFTEVCFTRNCKHSKKTTIH